MSIFFDLFFIANEQQISAHECGFAHRKTSLFSKANNTTCTHAQRQMIVLEPEYLFHLCELQRKPSQGM